MEITTEIQNKGGNTPTTKMPTSVSNAEHALESFAVWLSGRDHRGLQVLGLRFVSYAFVNFRSEEDTSLSPGDHRTSLKNLFQRMPNGQVHGAVQRIALGPLLFAEKNMISARPMKFS